MSRKRRKRIVCPNCDTPLKEQMNFCPKCGQENHIKRVSLKMLFNDFFATFFTFESKFFITFWALISKPAFLSIEYLNGKFEKYLRPIRLYFFISFAFFLLLKLSPTSDDSLIDFSQNDEKQTVINTKQDSEDDHEEDNNEIDFYFDNLNDDINQKLAKIGGDKRDYQIFINSIIDKSPIFLFFLIPIFSALLYLFFYQKKSYYVDHFVFAIHLQSFYFTLLVFRLIVLWITDFNLSLYIFIAFLIYGFIASRRFYKLKKITTFFRLSIIGILHLIISTFFALLFLIVILKYQAI